MPAPKINNGRATGTGNGTGTMAAGHISYYDDEFPLLEGNGLYASQTTGDGDCLFHSLSDQLYGHENCHQELRQRVVEHLRTHSSYFKVFIDVAPVRRAPRRRAAAGASSRADLATHSLADIDRAFEQRLQRMQRSGVFGDNLEIQAFAREFGVDVKIYQREHAYVICADNGSGNAAAENGDDRRVVHIAYHTWEHYSSIRNRAGPHTGPPKVCLRPVAITAEGAKEKLANSPIVLPWMEDAVAASLPYHEPPERIREVLERFKGNVNAAVSQLVDEWEAANLTDTETLANEEGQLEAGTAGGGGSGAVQEGSVETPVRAEAEAVQLQQQQLHVPTESAERKDLEPQEQQLRVELQQQIEQLNAERQRIDVQPPAEPAPEREPRQPPLPPVQPPPLPGPEQRHQVQVQQCESDQQQQSGLQRELDPIKEVVFDESANTIYGSPSSTVIAEATEADVGDLSRIKRRKSPDGSPVGINDVAGSVASLSFSSSSSSSSSSPSPTLSRSPSASDISFTERRRRKPLSASTTPTPTRRSSRIKAKAAAPPPPPPSPPSASKGPPRSRKQRRQAKRKNKAPATGSGSGSGSGGRKRKDVGMQTVTVGIRELYV